MTNAKCHMEIKRRIVIGEETFSKGKELLRGKLDRNQKKRMIKTNAMEYGVSCCMNHRHGLQEKKILKDWRPYKCEYGEKWGKIS